MLIVQGNCTISMIVGERIKCHVTLVENAVNRRCFTRDLTLSKSMCNESTNSQVYIVFVTLDP